MLLLRDIPAFEVLMVRRHEKMAFGGGALVFPGGRADPTDEDPAWEGFCQGWADTPPNERALRIAALRETFEESGVLLARTSAGLEWDMTPEAAAARPYIASGRRTFLDLMGSLGLRLDLGGLTLFARWITPAHLPKRFDTWFYLAGGAPGQLAAADGLETVDAEWIAPAEALRLGRMGERNLMFPTRMNLELLARSGGADQATREARARRIVPVEPRIERRERGPVVVIPEDAGYGLVEAPVEVLA